jgi:hypothetical protein
VHLPVEEWRDEGMRRDDAGIRWGEDKAATKILSISLACVQKSPEGVKSLEQGHVNDNFKVD